MQSSHQEFGKVWLLLSLFLALQFALFFSVGAQAASLKQRPLDPGEDDRIAVAPADLGHHEVRPGGTLKLVLFVRNYTDQVQRVRKLALPLVGSEDPGSFVAALTQKRTPTPALNTASWVTTELDRPFAIDHNSEVELPVTIKVPHTARPGAHAVAIGVTVRISPKSLGGLDSSSAHVAASAAPVSRVVISVSGEAKSSLILEKINAPRIVWGASKTSFDATVKNTGATLLQSSATVNMGAFLTTAKRTLKSKPSFVLPEGRRKLSVTWNDPPLLGRFNPTIVVSGGMGSDIHITRQLATVWVMPPWWLLLLTIGAIVLPVSVSRHRKRKQQVR